MHRLPSQRARDNDRLQVRIRAIHAASRGTYGSPRVHEQLTQEDCAVGRERVARLLRDMGLVGLPARRVRHTTDSTHGRPVAPNVLERHFEADHPNQRWTTDSTFIWTWEGWLYLAVVLDLYARRVVGWAVGVAFRPFSRDEDNLERRVGRVRLDEALGPCRLRIAIGPDRNVTASVDATHAVVGAEVGLAPDPTRTRPEEATPVAEAVVAPDSVVEIPQTGLCQRELERIARYHAVRKRGAAVNDIRPRQTHGALWPDRTGGSGGTGRAGGARRSGRPGKAGGTVRPVGASRAGRTGWTDGPGRAIGSRRARGTGGAVRAGGTDVALCAGRTNWPDAALRASGTDVTLRTG